MTTSENVAPQDLDSKIVNQLEYYFGNINLPRDKFLLDQLKLDDGWVPISVLLTFNRLSALSSDVSLIANAIKEGKSEIISVSEDGLKIRRNIGNPLPENSLEYWQKIKHCTVYMKGFNTDATLDELMEFTGKYGHVKNVLMRRTKPDRVFKGSIFATYGTREEAEVAQKSEDKYGEITLVKMMQDDYWTLKNKETKDKRASEKMAKSSKKAHDIVEKEQAKSIATFSKGLILSVDGLGEEATHQQVKEFFKQFGDVGYVVHEKGETKAELRFSGEENAAKAAWDKAIEAGQDGKVTFQEKELSANVLEGEEEEKYWTAFNADRQNRQNNFNNRRGGRGGGGRGARGNRGGRGRGGGRGRYGGQKRHADGDEGPRGKKTVFADDEGKPEVKAE